MKTVQKYNITSRKEVQEYIEKNEEKLGINEKEKKQLIKGVRGFKTTVEMRKIFIQECIKKIERKSPKKQGKFRHITKEERISIEILSTAWFKVSFIAAFVGKHRSSIKREIDRNAIEIWDIGSIKSPYRDKGQANIKCYVSEKAQEKAEANKLKNRKKCKLDRYKTLRWSVEALLREKKIEYSTDIIANLSKEGKIKGAETSIGANAIYRAVKERRYGLRINDLPHGRSYFKKRKNNPHTQTKEISERKKKYR